MWRCDASTRLHVVRGRFDVVLRGTLRFSAIRYAVPDADTISDGITVPDASSHVFPGALVPHADANSDADTDASSDAPPDAQAVTDAESDRHRRARNADT